MDANIFVIRKIRIVKFLVVFTLIKKRVVLLRLDKGYRIFFDVIVNR